jgi:hypothetical protein
MEDLHVVLDGTVIAFDRDRNHIEADLFLEPVDPAEAALTTDAVFNTIILQMDQLGLRFASFRGNPERLFEDILAVSVLYWGSHDPQELDLQAIPFQLRSSLQFVMGPLRN